MFLLGLLIYKWYFFHKAYTTKLIPLEQQYNWCSVAFLFGVQLLRRNV